MHTQTPTILVYGTPNDAAFYREVIEPGGWGLALDNGRARDVVFTIYENLARADAIIAFPTAHPVHLVTLLAESEVGHPLIVQGESARRDFTTKPIIFFGSPADWAPFQSVFQEMQAQGLIRKGLERLVTYHTEASAARQFIESELPPELPSTRLNYYTHAKKKADLEHELRDDIRPPADITVSCFGSASTTRPEHLDRADQAARMLARNGFNILHGGGDKGVMGQLSKTASESKTYTIGVTVHSSGAPKIFFEKAAGDRRPEEIDEHIASKDMLHRIETYAGNAEAFVSLDGGVGSVQEVLVIAELLARRHPVVMYQTEADKLARKPLWLLNESGIYSPLLDYLKERELDFLAEQIQTASTIADLEAGLLGCFTKKPPLPRSLRDEGEFRRRYFEVEQPRLPLGGAEG